MRGHEIGRGQKERWRTLKGRILVNSFLEVIFSRQILDDNYHLLTETEGNSVFCGPETVDVSRGEAEGNIDGRGSTKHTAFPRSQSISVLLYINSQRNNKLKNK